MTYIPAELRRLVVERANKRCEYCLRPHISAYPPHEVDHIYAEKHGGETNELNLCYSCYDCNHRKSSDLASLDPVNGQPSFLFHPRSQIWSDHFQLDVARIEGLTSQGRATVRLLRLNDVDSVDERVRLIKLGFYP